MPAKVWDERRQNWREATSTEIENAKRRAGATVKVVDYKAWKDQTSVTLGRRGARLQRVDYALAQYEAEPTALALWVLKTQFQAWKESKADWSQSSRNKNQLVTLLDRQLSGGSDIDMLSSDQAFMSEGLIHARLGIVYLYAHLDCDNWFNILTHGVLDVATAGVGYANVSTASTVLGKVPTVTDKIDEAVRNKVGNKSLQGTSINLLPEGKKYATPVWLNHDTPPPSGGLLRDLWEKIKEKLYAAAQKIYQLVRAKIDQGKDKAKEMWQNKGETAIEYVPGLLRKLVDFLLGKLVSALAPLIGGALDVAKGVATTISAVVDKVQEWQGRKNVQLLAGAPSTIAEAIRTAMSLCIGEGLYDMCKGVGNLAMDAGAGFSAGATSIAKLVIAVVEALTTTIYRLVEIQRMKACFADARGMWLTRDDSKALHKQPIAFNNWFKSYALTTPALAMLALNSGICGDKMHFLQMFQDDSRVISQASFDAGVKYVDELKIWGSDYLKDAGFNFVSNDAMTTGLIKLATSHKDPDESVVKRVLFGFLGA
jgi:hypothetical protein